MPNYWQRHWINHKQTRLNAVLMLLALALSLLISRHHPVNLQCTPSTRNDITIWLVCPYPLQRVNVEKSPVWMLQPLTLISNVTLLQTHIQLKPGVTLLGPEAYHPPPSCAKVRNERSSISAPLLPLLCVWQHVRLGWWDGGMVVNDEFKTMCKESIQAHFNALPQIVWRHSRASAGQFLGIWCRYCNYKPWPSVATALDGRHKTQMNNTV